MIKLPAANPMMKKEEKPTDPMYSGSRNKYGIPKVLEVVFVIHPKSMIQYNKSKWFFFRSTTTSCTGNE